MTVKFSFYFFAALLAFNACKSNEQNIAVETLNESLETSIQLFEKTNEELYESLEDRLHDPQSVEVSKIWQPKAISVKNISKDLFNQIDSLKKVLKNRNQNVNNPLEIEKSNWLYENFKIYRSKIINLDIEMYNYIKKTLALNLKILDLEKSNSSDFYKTFFSHNSKLSPLSVLTNFQNNIKIAEHEMVKYCYYRTGSIRCGIQEHFKILINQNSTHFKPGEILEINAGIGAYSAAATPFININGQDLISSNAQANYKTQVPNKKGEYIIPIKIKYRNQNGEEQEVVSEVEYIVDE